MFTGAAGQAQAFRERPDSVQVRAGSDVFLRCAVDHQQGKAQWTKDGFALGECSAFSALKICFSQFTLPGAGVVRLFVRLLYSFLRQHEVHQGWLCSGSVSRLVCFKVMVH